MAVPVFGLSIEDFRYACGQITIFDGSFNAPTGEPFDVGREFEGSNNFPEMKVVTTPTDGGIREEVPNKYKDRFA